MSRRAGLTSIAAACLLAVAPLAPAWALAIPVGSAAADDLILNFDLSGQTPPPYADVATTLVDVTPLDLDAVLTIDRFGAPDAGSGLLGSSVIIGTGNPIAAVTVTATDPGIVDGIYSIGVRLSAGTAAFDGASATGRTAEDVRVTVAGTPEAAPLEGVPEPASLALLGMGVAGLGVTRRRRR